MVVGNLKSQFIKMAVFIASSCLIISSVQAQSLKEQYNSQQSVTAQPKRQPSSEVKAFLQEAIAAQRAVMKEGRVFIIPIRTSEGYGGKREWGRDSGDGQGLVLYEYGQYLFSREIQPTNGAAVWKGKSLICPKRGKAISLLKPMAKVEPDGVASFAASFGPYWFVPINHTSGARKETHRFEVNLQTQECYSRYTSSGSKVGRCTMYNLEQARQTYRPYGLKSEKWAKYSNWIKSPGSYNLSDFAECKVEVVTN